MWYWRDRTTKKCKTFARVKCYARFIMHGVHHMKRIVKTKRDKRIYVDLLKITTVEISSR